MGNVKISELPRTTTLSDADAIPVVQGGVTKKFTGALTALKSLLGIDALNGKMFFGTWLPYNGYDILAAAVDIPLQVFSCNTGNLPAQGVPAEVSPYGTCICFGGIEYKILLYIDVFGQVATYNTQLSKWEIVTTKDSGT